MECQTCSGGSHFNKRIFRRGFFKSNPLKILLNGKDRNLIKTGVHRILLFERQEKTYEIDQLSST